jgi:hypothetical protein
MGRDGQVETFDGVAVVKRGDLIQILYAAPARLHRTRWLFDRIDERTGGMEVLALMVVLSTADPPDAETRAENTSRLRRIGPRLRRLVTVPLGDTFFVSIVRTVMRGLAVIHGNVRTHFVANSVDEGLVRVIQASRPATPSGERIREDLRALYAALGVRAPVTLPAQPRA